MRTSPSALLATSAALLLAPALGQDACAGDKSSAVYCAAVTYADRTASVPDPPSTAECQDTCRGVLQDPSDWGVHFAGEPDGYRQKLLGYPCGFSVGRGDGEPADLSFSMSNQDILDIVGEATRRFGGAHGGAVAAEGTMRCEGHAAKWYID